jgi:hypothetical protein
MNDSKKPGVLRIDELLGGLPHEIAPPPGLWAGVKARIAGNSADAEVLLDRLPQEIPPPEHLWAGVASSLRPVPARRPVVPWVRWTALARVAGFVAFVVVAGLASLRLGMLGRSGTPEAPADRGAEALVDETAWLAAGAFDASAVGASAVDAALEETRRTYLEEIKAVRRERETIEASLALYPEDMTLHELWRHAYESELLLIDDAERVLTFMQTG